MDLLAALLSLASLARLAAATTVTVNVPALGDIVGIARTDTNAFLGIKYASALRFEDPQPVSHWPNPYDATTVGAACYQSCPNIPDLACQEDISEDCLFLNIYTPSGNPPGTCVMFFVHGGNFASYSGGSELYDGDVFVNEGGCILVTMNYRLAAFGFLGSRNLGVKDQIAALEWIHTYIQYFGGDNTQITAFGQSAGAQSTALLMSVPSASQYFNSAILQSCPFTLPFRTAAQGESQEAQLATLMGCTVGNLTCYREADADDILTFQGQVTLPGATFLLAFQFWGPVIDGTLVKDHLYNIFERGLHKKMNTIIGTVQDEGVGYIFSIYNNPINSAELESLLATVNPSLSLGLLGLFYDINANADKRFVLSEMTTDYVFNCVSRAVSDIVADDSRSFNYVFDQLFPYDIWGPGNVCNNYVCHGIEIPSVFGTYDLGNYTLPPDQEELSDDIIKYWTNFAKYGKPFRRNMGLVKWQRYSFWRQRFLILDAANTRQTTNIANSARCLLFELFVGYNPYST
ncbi:cAMP-regulated D2 protein-like [Haliotis cracherodii]|uniref:cAMP-regulated D2 protein-like n=1 Tax=Haliotis cracherodii TaxID=6455 RepID=UPI0039ECBFDF